MLRIYNPKCVVVEIPFGRETMLIGYNNFRS
jgi:hypothetical protein